MKSSAKLLIEELSPEQVASLPAFRDKWLRIGLSTNPADRPRAEAGIKLAYQAAGLPEPKMIIWLRSPVEGSIASVLVMGLPRAGGYVADEVSDQVWKQVVNQATDQAKYQVWRRAISQVRDQVEKQVVNQVWRQVTSQVRDQVWRQSVNQVEDQVKGQVNDQVWEWIAEDIRDQIQNQVRDQVEDQVYDQIQDQINDQISTQIKNQVQTPTQAGDSLYRCGYGLHDATWLSTYDAFRSLGVEGLECLEGLMEIAQSAGWFWPFRGLCIVTERPSVLHRDSLHRLHCETGPAIAYPDGWGVYAWHGVRVPQAIIEHPESITADSVFDETNAEVRRVMIELYGRERLLTDERVTLIDSAPDHGASYHHIDLGDDIKWGFLALQCPTTGKHTVLWANPKYPDCLSALAASHRLQRHEYAPAVET